MKVYVASRLENIEMVRVFNGLLRARGHEITYDWTVHGSVQNAGADRITEVAISELDGVRRADVVVALLPGGRGTHAEIGAALACGILVIMCSEDDSLFQHDTRTCAFYWHPLAKRVIGGLLTCALAVDDGDYRARPTAGEQNQTAGDASKGETA